MAPRFAGGVTWCSENHCKPTQSRLWDQQTFPPLPWRQGWAFFFFFLVLNIDVSAAQMLFWWFGQADEEFWRRRWCSSGFRESQNHTAKLKKQERSSKQRCVLVAFGWIFSPFCYTGLTLNQSSLLGTNTVTYSATVHKVLLHQRHNNFSGFFITLLTLFI